MEKQDFFNPTSALEENEMDVTAIKSDQQAEVMSATDETVVQKFEGKLQLIRDRVASIALGYHTGCYLVGRPGTSKSYTVKEELSRSSRPWIFQNARMTPMGLFGFLADHPEHVIVLDDITSLFKNEQALQILLAALDGTPGQPRTITYKSSDKDVRFEFTGSIIAISNVPLRHDPLARALGSRIIMVEHEPTDEEIARFIRHLALQGYEDMQPDECLHVADFLIAETRVMDQRLDLRHLTKAWQDYRQTTHGNALTSWQDLVRSSLQKQVTEPVRITTKKEEIEVQRQLVSELMANFPDDRHRQLSEWPHSQSLFYVRLKEVTATNRAA